MRVADVSALLSEMWHLALTHLDATWKPVAAHVCSTWRALIPAEHRRLDVKAARALWRILGACPSAEDGIRSWSMTVSRAARALDLGIEIKRLSTHRDDACRLAKRIDDGDIAIEDVLVAAAHLNSRSLVDAVVSFLIDTAPYSPGRDKSGAEWEAARERAYRRISSARALLIAARCGATRFISGLHQWVRYRRLLPLHEDFWLDAVDSAYRSVILAGDVEAFLTLRFARVECNLHTLNAALDDPSCAPIDPATWISAISRQYCARCLCWIEGIPMLDPLCDDCADEDRMGG
ncbi:hypothetical protein psal_cds_1054 [Pandoravirus salinus]|uniref:F-box incomplete domain containing protein n=1 Tax=Pandoravirus salinus TaxID=1349410 RepID=S4W3L5_9VIRU|nr:hypothetical protein psal_cds_1054 [Pandoravirus salinus]AGO85257.2 hypothetical protein psal_cds_1054 [Pandoravirus salinus]